ncbi:hypothetical protein BK133_01165 [Paenibacillus sp. FSL H8-0548]|uniref:carbohydrate-binding protein n=1 Tax=Paenibacillus sp. FSL H8-0548 TaxID=1920422 RepID=UPI00096C60A8|nr:carbohydrate-binding protein [Paenibacillus sp. FSL H8-0548]OMF38839.1 hypothetical protein BK133_01165 [Paenibacillus sp. FSL H8-0548]
MKRFRTGKMRMLYMIMLSLFILVSSIPSITIFAQESIAGNDASSHEIDTIITDFKPQAVPVVSEEGFTHPGIYVTAENLNVMQEMVREGYEPWASAFEQFRRDSRAQKDYKLQNEDGNGNPYIDFLPPGTGSKPVRFDADAAYAQTIMWYVTGDSAYRDNAIKIIRAWYTSLRQVTEAEGYDWSADVLSAGMSTNKFSFAAEILRYTPGSGWTEEDTVGFTQYLDYLWPMYNRDEQFMNQGSVALMGFMSSAVFRDDADDYAKAIDRATVNSASQNSARGFSIEDQMRMVTYNAATGEAVEPHVQLVEMGRDQPHAEGDVAGLSNAAQIAYAQGTLVNENGEIAEDGTTLFEFLDKRIMKATNQYSKYNLGYAIDWTPVYAGWTNWEDPVNASGDIYNVVATNGRYRLGLESVVYYHYKYKLGVNENDPDFKYIKQAKELYGLEISGQDNIANSDLLLAPIEAKTGEPLGAPRPIIEAGYLDNIAGFDRFQASEFDGKSGQGILEDYRDEYGLRQITSGFKKNEYMWYKDFDFGNEPVNSIILNSGSNSEAGSHVQMILLDQVEGIDYTNVTAADLAKGEIVADFYSGATGWWTTLSSKSEKLLKELSGTHSFALLMLGSTNVYGLQTNMDWISFARSYAHETNEAEAADEFVNGATRSSAKAIMPNGSAISYKMMDFDYGTAALEANLSTTGAGVLEVRKDAIDGPLAASYSLPNTNGVSRKVQLAATESDDIIKLLGKNDVYLVYKGEGALELDTYRNFRLVQSAVFPKIQSESYTTLREGLAAKEAEGSISFVRTAAGNQPVALVYFNNSFGEGIDTFSIRLRSNGIATIEIANETGNNDGIVFKPYAKLLIPNTEGEWTTVAYDMSESQANPTGTQVIYVTVNGAQVDLDYMQFNADNHAPVIQNPSFESGILSLPPDSEGVVTDYLIAGNEYRSTYSALDKENDHIEFQVQNLPAGAEFNQESNTLSWTPQAEEANKGQSIYIIANDGEATSVVKRKLYVFEDADAVISKITEGYDPAVKYANRTLKPYQMALTLVNSIKGDLDESFYEALAILKEKVDLLWSLDAIQRENGTLNIVGFTDIVTSDGKEGKSTFAIAEDNDLNTSPDMRLNGTGAGWMVLDFKEGYGVRLSKVDLAARTGFAGRINGARIEGSNDLVTWKQLTTAAANTEAWQSFPVTDQETYRYLRMSNPGNSWYGNIGEIRFYGIYDEIIVLDEIKQVSISSNHSNSTIAALGDTVTLSFVSNEVIEGVTATVNGNVIHAESADGLNWQAHYVVGEVYMKGKINFSIAYKNGKPVTQTTDASAVTLIEENGLIKDVVSKAVFIDSTPNRTQEASASQVQALFDNDPLNTSDFRGNNGSGGTNGAGWIVFDFKAGFGVKLNMIKLLARQDQLVRANGVIFQGSNDNLTWTNLTAGAQSMASWQSFAVTDSTTYRYLKLSNPSNGSWFGNLGEVKLYGQVIDRKAALTQKLAEAKALNEAAYTAESWAALAAAVAQAEAVHQEADPADLVIQAAAAVIGTAIAGLAIVEEPAAPAAVTLTGTEQALTGEEIELTAALSGSVDAFTVMDAIVHYDPAKLTFVTESWEDGEVALADEAIISHRDGLQVIGTRVKQAEGQIRIIMAAAGEQYAVDEAGALFTLKGKIKADAEAGIMTVSLTDFTVSINENASVLDTLGASLTIEVRVADKAQLIAIIVQAKQLYQAAVVGTAAGQYSQTVKDAFEEAIEAAEAVSADSGANETEVSEAAAALSSAISVFTRAVNPTVPVDPANKTALIAAINAAQAKYDRAVEGEKVGHYEIGSKAVLQTAISAAAVIRNHPSSTQSEVDLAVTALNQAVESYAKKIVSLVEGAVQITIRDLSVIAQYFGTTSQNTADWSKVSKADIYGEDQITIRSLAAVARMILSDWMIEE